MMRNPLTRRLPRELIHDFGKYFVIFVFLIALIGVVSGFIVADDSFYKVYTEGFQKQVVEDGHLATDKPLTEELIDAIEAEGDVTLYEYPYFEETLGDTEKNIRVYSLERDVNLLSLIEGEYPEGDDEIALDRMFADNNAIVVGDQISFGGRSFTVRALIASPDYSCLFENNTDMMFDSINFGIAVLPEEAFQAFETSRLTYNYVWLYPEFIERTDLETAKNRSDDFIDALEVVFTDEADRIIDEAVAYGKIIFMHEALEEIAESLEPTGMTLEMFDNEEGYAQILEMIETALDEEGVDLSEELSEGERNVTLSVADVEAAFQVSDAEIEAAEDYLDGVEDAFTEIEDYVPRYLNQAINFTGDDMGGDRSMILVFCYLLILVLAFVFAVTITSTIAEESGVIGTLRATGYSRGQLVAHYMILPILVSLVAAVIGNILGYTVFNDLIVDIYNGSFSLAKYEQYLSPEAFVLTTVYPLIIMFVINLLVLLYKLSFTPLQFLRHETTRSRRKKAFRLNTKIPFMHRFRIRIIFQNISSYIVLLLGVWLGGLLLVFGLMFTPLLEDYRDIVLEDRISDYQYVLMEEAETSDPDAEKYLLTSLKTTDENFKEDEISVFGIWPDSTYISADIEDGKMAVSSSIAEKFSLQEGDTITLKDPYNAKKTYDFTVGSIYDYRSGLAIFMAQDAYLDYFEEELSEMNFRRSDEGEEETDTKERFTGYFSNSELTDIEEEKIATVITLTDLTKVSDQLIISMGSTMGIIKYFAIIVFVLLMFLMTKQVIEKNAQSISMTKILGFRNGEIGGLYLVASSIVVIIALLTAVPLIDRGLRLVFEEYLYTEMTGYIPYIISNQCYVNMVITGIICYVFIAVVLMVKISRISKSDALKNAE